MPYLVPIILVILAVLVLTGFMPVGLALWIGGGVIVASILIAILVFGFAVWALNR